MPRVPKPPKSEDDDTKPYASPTKTPPTSPRKTLNIKKWSYDDKLDILKDILETAVPDWEKIAHGQGPMAVSGAVACLSYRLL